MLAPISTPPIPLSDAVDALGCERIDGLTDSALEEDLVDIRRQIDRLEGEFLRRLHRFDRSHAALVDGCDRPPEWTDGHHIQHWVDLGPTEVPNLVLLCRRHHRFVHEKRWQVRLDEHGTVLITPPP